MLEFEHKVGVKICGVTTLEDALACAGAGADMIGLNFSPRSVRCITPTIGREIIAALRRQFSKVKVAGVFVNQESALVQKIAADLTLDAVQLHGDESADYVRELDARFVIKALRIGLSGAAAGVGYDSGAILLDTWDRARPGGTGRTFPWSIAAALRPQVTRLILAGGLTSHNVGEAIRTVRPFAVDVSSGVEIAPGRKDEAKVRAFLEAVRAVEEEKNG
jgi:phosphoribosylanthranilate isomerase